MTEPINRRYNIPQILKTRDRLLATVEWDLHGAGTPEFILQLAKLWHPILAKYCSFELLKECLWCLHGQELSPELMRLTAWRLAGNLRSLQLRRPVHPWQRQPADEWVPVQIVSMIPRLSRKEIPGQWVELKVLAGSPAGLSIERFWSNRVIALLARRLGFTAPWGSHPYRHPWELVSFRFRVLISPEFTVEGKPGFREIEEKPPAGLMNHNRRLIKLRDPRHRDCPMDYKHPCHFCQIGYTNPLCPLSSHAESWLAGDCDECGKLGWFDRHRSSRLCVSCLTKAAYRRRSEKP